MDLTDVGFTENGALLIPLRKEDFGLSDEKIEFQNAIFDPKGEVHITVIGKDLGWELEQAIECNPSIETRLRQAVAKAAWQTEGWSSAKKGKLYHLSKDKEEPSSDGSIEVVHAESIVLMVEAPGVEEFYEEICGITGKEYEVPPIHVTLYTCGDPSGIGLPDQAALDRFVTREVSPNELRKLSSQFARCGFSSSAEGCNDNKVVG